MVIDFKICERMGLVLVLLQGWVVLGLGLFIWAFRCMGPGRRVREGVLGPGI